MRICLTLLEYTGGVMSNIKIKKIKGNNIKYVISVAIEPLYTQGVSIMEEFKPLEITIDDGGINIGYIKIKSKNTKSKFGRTGFDKEEVLNIIKALELAISINDYDLEIE